MRLISKVFRKTFVQLILLYVLLAALAVSFGDRGWYEPDGIAILAGSLNLPLAKQGNFFLYAYDTQPLAYELNHFVFRLLKDPRLLYLLPAFCGALAICFLAFGIYLFSGRRLNIFFSFCILLFFPELFFRLLYPNSSVFGMVFFAFSLLLLFHDQPDNFYARWRDIKYSLIGITSVVACFFRCDFLLGLPMLAYLVMRQAKEKKAFIFYALASAVTLAFGFFAGIFKPAEIIKISSFYSLLAQEPSYWSRWKSAVVLFFTTNIFIWFILFSYAAIKSLKLIYRRRWLSFAAIVPAVLLFYPLAAGLTSAHYVLTAICFAPFAVVGAGLDFSKTKFAAKIKLKPSRIAYILAASGIFLQFFSIDIISGQTRLPHFAVTQNPVYILTHDGPRFSGAYLKGYYQVYKSNKSPNLILPLGLAHAITQVVKSSRYDFLMVYAKRLEGNHLISLGLYSVPFFLEVEGYTLNCIKDGLALVNKHNRLLIKGLNLEEYENFDKTKIPDGIKLIEVPLISRTSGNIEKELKLYLRRLVALAH